MPSRPSWDTCKHASLRQCVLWWSMPVVSAGALEGVGRHRSRRWELTFGDDLASILNADKPRLHNHSSVNESMAAGT